MATRAQSAFSRADRVSSAYSGRPVSAPSPGRPSQSYSHSTQTFMTGPAADVLRVRLRQAAHFRNFPLPNFLRNHQIAITNALSRQKGLIQVVFPQDKKSQNIDRWSLQLLCIVLRSTGCLASQEVSDVTLLEKSYRIHFRMRPQSTRVKSLRPKREWIQVCSAVQRLVENTGDPVLIKTVRNFICQVEMGTKKVQAHRDMQRRLYETLFELISNNPESKYTVHNSNGKIIEKKMKELDKLKQTYEDLGSRPSAISWAKENTFDESNMSKPRLVSSISFQSPYETNSKWSKPTQKLNETTLRVKREGIGELNGRVSPYAGRDIAAKVAYQRALSQSKQVQEYRMTNSRPASVKVTKFPDLYKQRGANSTRKQSTLGNRDIPEIKRTLPKVNIKSNSHIKNPNPNSLAKNGPVVKRTLKVSNSERENNINNDGNIKSKLSREYESVSFQNIERGKDKSNKLNKENTMSKLSRQRSSESIKNIESSKDKNIKDKAVQKLHRQHKGETNRSSSMKKKVVFHDKLKRKTSNLSSDTLGKSYRKPTVAKVNNTNKSNIVPDEDNNSAKHINKKATAIKPMHTTLKRPKQKKTASPKVEKAKYIQPKDDKLNTSKPKLTRTQPMKIKNRYDRQLKDTNIVINDQNYNDNINLGYKEDTLVAKHSKDDNANHDTNKTALDKAEESKVGETKSEIHKPTQDIGNDEFKTLTDEKQKSKMENEIVVSETDLMEILNPEDEQKTGRSQKTDTDIDEKEMRRIAMEVLVHQNIRSVVNHRLFKNKNNIDNFFDFLYKNHVVKKFLKSLNSEPYKQWDHVPGKTDYFYFLHCFIFRQIDPQKDEAFLYTVEKILTRMQCQHLRTPRPKTSMGSMFKNRKSLLMEALEYSRSHTQPSIKTKSPTGSRSNSPQNLSKSYTASGSSTRSKSYLPVSSRSVSATPRLPASSSRCWKCKQKDLAMKISINWGNICICDLLLKEGVHYKIEYLLPAVKINSISLLSEIVTHLKERSEWDCDDKHAKDALHEAKKLRIVKIVDYLEAEGIEDDRQVRKVCVTCLF